MSETKIEVKSVEFLKKGWVGDIDRAIRRHDKMIEEMREFVEGVKNGFEGFRDEMRGFREGVRDLTMKIDELDRRMIEVEKNVMLTKDDVGRVDKEMHKRWEEHRIEMEEKKGILGSIFGKWKEK